MRPKREQEETSNTSKTEHGNHQQAARPADNKPKQGAKNLTTIERIDWQ
jgi:hypothetical protein